MAKLTSWVRKASKASIKAEPYSRVATSLYDTIQAISFYNINWFECNEVHCFVMGCSMLRVDF